jgi:cytochrome P450 family 6
VLIRVANERYEVPNGRVTLEKGMSVFVPVYAIHKDANYYPNPEEFDPERFSPEETKKRHPYTFLPFGEGPRSCIGIRFGQLQTKFGLAVLLSKYQFRVNEKTREPIELEPLSVLMAPKGGIWLEAEKIVCFK